MVTSVGGYLALSSHSLYEASEHLQWPSHEDRTINSIVGIILSLVVVVTRRSLASFAFVLDGSSCW